jgi:competence protein ComEA
VEGLVEGEVPRPSVRSAREQWAARWSAWRSDRRIAAGLLACVAVAAAVAWFRTGTGSSPGLPRAAPAPPGATATTGVGATTTTMPPPVVVDVVGAVARPGVVRLPPGARVVDAIGAAGGSLPGADTSRLNLAAPLADGSRVAVPRLGGPTPTVDPAAVSGGAAPALPGDGRPGGPAAPVNLNTATADALDALPGIGPATAAAIVADRAAHGPFRSVDDLGRVRGIGDAKLAQLRDLVAV